jgi:hypothetical protein
MMTTVTVDTLHEPFWARWVSNLLSPPVIWGLLAVPIAFRGNPAPERGWMWAGIYIALVCVLPSAYVGVMVLTGSITDLHMRVRAQRYRPFIFSIITTVIALFALRAAGAPPFMLVFTLITLVQIVVMLSITLYWQISMHMMSVTSAMLALGALYGLSGLLVSAPMIPLVGAARYALKRHTLAQLIAGSLLGGGLTMLLYTLAAIG